MDHPHNRPSLQGQPQHQRMIGSNQYATHVPLQGDLSQVPEDYINMMPILDQRNFVPPQWGTYQWDSMLRPSVYVQNPLPFYQHAYLPPPQYGSAQPWFYDPALPSYGQLAGVHQPEVGFRTSCPPSLLQLQPVPRWTSQPPPASQQLLPPLPSIRPQRQPQPQQLSLQPQQNSQPASVSQQQSQQAQQPSLQPQQNSLPASVSQQQSQQAQPSYAQIDLGKYLQDTNLRHLFPGKDFTIQEGYAYVEFPSTEEANTAKDRLSFLNVAVGVNPPLNCPSKVTALKPMVQPTNNDGSEIEAKLFQEKLRPSLALAFMGWRPFLEFLKERGKCVVEPYKFNIAAKIGSVSPLVEMAKSTTHGNRLGAGFTDHMGQAHLAGRSWAGGFSQDDMVVSRSFLCMIDLFPSSLATYENIKKDLLVLIKHLFKLYKINGRMPSYFDDLLERMRNPPKDGSNPDENLKTLSLYYRKLVNNPGYASEDQISFLLQEIHVNVNVMSDFGMDFPEDAEATNLAKFVEIDNLLKLVCRNKQKESVDFVKEGGYLRHVVVHSSEKIEEFFPVKERIALIGWYFEKFMPIFVDLMIENTGNKDWLKEICQIYQKESFELGAMQYREIYPLSKETTAVNSAADVAGVGLRNDPGENNCFLNVTIQLLFYVNTFRERILQMDDLAEHSVVYELNYLFKALIAAHEKPGDIVTARDLRTALGTICPDEHFEKGREHEVTLALKLILSSVHLACVGQPSDYPCSCAAHKIFGLDGLEWIACTCGSSSDKKKYNSFSMSITASSLLESMKDCLDSSFCDHLIAVLLEDQFPCADDGCEAKNHFSRALTSSPPVCTIEIEWRPCDEDVAKVMNSMTSGIDLSTVFEDAEQGTTHNLASMACFSGMHYVCFILQDDVWIMFNDLKVQEIGSWLELVSFCVAGGWKPTLMFFSSASSLSSGESGSPEVVGGN